MQDNSDTINYKVDNIDYLSGQPENSNTLLQVFAVEIRVTKAIEYNDIT